jgi:hypothetical protein
VLGPVKDVEEGFRYASNTNAEWLDGHEFRRLLQKAV